MAPDQVNDQLLTKNGVPWYAKWIDMELKFHIKERHFPKSKKKMDFPELI